MIDRLKIEGTGPLSGLIIEARYPLTWKWRVRRRIAAQLLEWCVQLLGKDSVRFRAGWPSFGPINLSNEHIQGRRIA